VAPAPTPFERALTEAGGTGAAGRLAAGLRAQLLDELERSREELERSRSGYGHPVLVAVATEPGRLIAVAPLDPALRADPGVVGERAWLVAAALTGALVEAARGEPANEAAGSGAELDGGLLAGSLEGWLALALPASPALLDGAEELAALAFDEFTAGVDRLRARGAAVPSAVLAGIGDLREPIGDAHPLRVAAAVARLGGNPADADSIATHEDEVLAALAGGESAARPHEERDPELRIARRILQRLAGMGKWGGYHTEMAHLARGFPGHERAAALRIGELLLTAGLLLEKPSVGQRHVYLNPRRARDIYAVIETGTLPAGVVLDGH
jgi:hypothetical protein